MYSHFCHSRKITPLNHNKKSIYLSINATWRGMATWSSEITQLLKYRLQQAILIQNFSQDTSFPIFLCCLTAPDDFYDSLTLKGTTEKTTVVIQQETP